MCDTWKCPRCGALVCLTATDPDPTDVEGEIRIDQLAQASCGCWVEGLSPRAVARLLEAIVNLDDERTQHLFCARRF